MHIQHFRYFTFLSDANMSVWKYVTPQSTISKTCSTCQRLQVMRKHPVNSQWHKKLNFNNKTPWHKTLNIMNFSVKCYLLNKTSVKNWNAFSMFNLRRCSCSAETSTPPCFPWTEAMESPSSTVRRRAWINSSRQWLTLEELDPEGPPCNFPSASIADDDVFSDGKSNLWRVWWIPPHISLVWTCYA